MPDWEWVVLSPEALLKEIDALEASGVPVQDRLKISAACPLILPYHVALDQAREARRGEKNRHDRSWHWPLLRGQSGEARTALGDLRDPTRFAETLEGGSRLPKPCAGALLRCRKAVAAGGAGGGSGAR